MNTTAGCSCRIERPLLFGSTKIYLSVRLIDGGMTKVKIVLGRGRLSTEEIIFKLERVVQNLEQLVRQLKRRQP